jgi:hypothetical protein
VFSDAGASSLLFLPQAAPGESSPEKYRGSVVRRTVKSIRTVAERRAKPLGAGGVLAMKKYGLVLADNGSAWYFQGTADTRWPNALLDQLKRVPASAFEAVDTSSLMISPNSMQVDAPP